MTAADPHAAPAIGVAVFAKAPVAGLAKTRLIPRLGPEGAARLHALLVERAVGTAAAAGLGPVSLWCAPDCADPLFRALARRHGLDLQAQAQGDLGRRMLDAFQRLDGPALLIGTDCPALTAEHLRAAAAALVEGADAAFLPAEDGGYGLVGLRRPTPALFLDMEWSTPSVMAETRRRLAAQGLDWREPAVVWDVDRPEDLDRIELGSVLGSAFHDAVVRK